MIFAGTVMHYSPAPALWFSNILNCCSIFMVQDLINRRRSNIPPYLAVDGDAVRYSYWAFGIESEHREAFDLGALGAKCLKFSTYPADAGALHFVALFEGRGAHRKGGHGASFRSGIVRARLGLAVFRIRAWLKAGRG